MKKNQSRCRKNNHLIIVISGPSGSGKTTIVKKLLAENKNLIFSPSYTTRKKREGEVQGKDYFFVSLDKFKKMIKEKKFLEYAKVHNNFYGTSKEFVLKKIKKNDIVLDIDVKGALQLKKVIKKLNLKSIFIFIMPPTFRELKKRLILRQTDTKEEILRRMSVAKKEIKYKNDYDYVVKNDNLEDAVRKINSIIISHM